MACQEMKPHFDSGNSKHDVITLKTSSSYKLQEDRVWEGKDILYSKSMILPLEYRRKEINKKSHISTEDINYYRIFTHNSHRLSVKSNSKSKQVIVYL